jgi:hypothetical protein
VATNRTRKKNDSVTREMRMKTDFPDTDAIGVSLGDQKKRLYQMPAIVEEESFSTSVLLACGKKENGPGMCGPAPFYS